MSLGSFRLPYALAIVLMALGSVSAGAQTYPDRAVRVIVPFAAGGPIDLAMRIIAERLKPILGRSIVVENRPGAGGITGMQAVAHAEPDGYTLGWSSGAVPLAGLLQDTPYRIDAELEKIGYYADLPMVLFAYSGLPAKNVSELISYAKAHPNALAVASTGAGSLGHLTQELFKREAGIEMQHVPYRGSSQYMPDLLTGRVQLSIDGMALALASAKTGSVKLLAVTTASRVPAVPDVPTIGESGVPGFEASSWMGLWAPRGVDPKAMAIIHNAMKQVLSMPDVQERFKENGAIVRVGDAADMRARADRELQKWLPIIEIARGAVR